jgi:hypothetical protein
VKAAGTLFPRVLGAWALLGVLYAPGFAQAPAGRPSGELVFNVMTDYFTRYFCITRFPETRSRIDAIYFASPLRRVVVQCEALRCVDPELTRSLQKLWDDAARLPEADARKLCTQDYERAVRNTERRYASELKTLRPVAPSR